ncbi:MAG: 3-deoxy-8-phosphooctulonate synthase [Flavobacteriaceae bacterium]|jgi:2-dehydro-3-deoxyphosphooctonate aldolase (KDO 8-P synthase)
MLVAIDKLKHIASKQFLLIAGPCAIEGEAMALEIASHLVALSERYKIPLVFKGSYRKANRSRLDSFTGIGDKKALAILQKVGERFTIPTLTDIHHQEEAALAASYVDVLQIPAFLVRQTDLLVAAAKTGKVVNLKKGQFMSPESMAFAAQKLIDSGNANFLLTDRGTQFGYTDLVVDFRGISSLQKIGPTLLDVTHSLQQPNQASGVTGGRPEKIETLARAAIATGADGIFIETHPNPKKAKSDGANMLALDQMEPLLQKLVALRNTILSFSS